MKRAAIPAPVLNLGRRAMTAPLSLKSAPLVLVERPQDGPLPIARRAKIWELSRYLHCSIIGTCLSTAELRHILAKSGFLTDGACDHELHGRGVTVAGQSDVAGKLLHKALDKRHRQAINQFAKAKSAAELTALWRDLTGADVNRNTRSAKGKDGRVEFVSIDMLFIQRISRSIDENVGVAKLKAAAKFRPQESELSTPNKVSS